jgi:dolichol-phosphate mannosyltransferase
MQKTLSVIIPCFNEAATIKEVVAQVRAAPLPEGWHKDIIVVDDGSGEETLHALREVESLARVIYRSQNAGKGVAVKSGLGEAVGDYLVVQDADLELSPAQYGDLLEPVLSGRAQATFGYRVMASASRSYNPLLFWGGRAVSILYNLVFFKNYRDIPCCYKLFPRSCVPALLAAPSEDFVFDAVEMTHVISQACTVAQVPVTYRPRSRAQGKKIRAYHGIYSAFAIVFIRLGLHRGPVQHELRRMTRYVVTGAISAAVDLGALWALTELAGIWYLASSVAAFIISYGVNFLLHKYWTFKSLNLLSMKRELPLHLSLALINLGLNTLLVYAFVEYLGVWYFLAQVIVAGIIALESFTLLSRFIFRDKLMLH